MDQLVKHLPSMSSIANLSVSLRESETSTCSRATALKAAKAILGSFRRSDADDPEVFVAAVVRVFQAYPEAMVVSLADPLTGIAGRQTFLPSPAELKAELDRLMAPILARQERERRDAEFRARQSETVGSTDPAEVRARAAAAWERQRDGMRGRRDRDAERAEAEKRLGELARAPRTPPVIGPDLAVKLKAMREDHRTSPEAQPPPARGEQERASA